MVAETPSFARSPPTRVADLLAKVESGSGQRRSEVGGFRRIVQPGDTEIVRDAEAPLVHPTATDVDVRVGRSSFLSGGQECRAVPCPGSAELSEGSPNGQS